MGQKQGFGKEQQQQQNKPNQQQFQQQQPMQQQEMTVAVPLPPVITEQLNIKEQPNELDNNSVTSGDDGSSKKPWYRNGNKKKPSGKAANIRAKNWYFGWQFEFFQVGLSYSRKNNLKYW